MKLAEKDADLFFELMRLLQVFVNQRLRLLPDITTVAAYQAAEPEDRMLLRNALWDNAHLISKYVQANPDDLNHENIELVRGWLQFKRGDFFLERLLKKYAVFISDNNVYGVLGLYDSLNQMFSQHILPVYLQAVLLPFKGVIVYDGLLSSYPVIIGGGMKKTFKDTYLKAKREGRIIVSFDPQTQESAAAKMKKPLKDWRPMVDDLVAEAKSLRAQPGSPPAWGASFSMVKASLAFTQAVLSAPDDIDKVWKQFERLYREMDKLEDALFRSF